MGKHESHNQTLHQTPVTWAVPAGAGGGAGELSVRREKTVGSDPKDGSCCSTHWTFHESRYQLGRYDCMAFQAANVKKDPSKRKRPWKKLFKYLLILFFMALLVSVSAITHEYGPYMGRVIDKENGEPIDGAAVLLVFYTKGIYAVSSYAGAIETLTDKNGEFSFPKKRIFTLHPFNEWWPYCHVTIFKPGYGSFPNHKESGPKYSHTYSIPEAEYYTVNLPKLLTDKERKESIMMFPNIPKRRMKNLIRLRGKEERVLGLTP